MEEEEQQDIHSNGEEDDEMFDNFEDGDVQSYKNFQFGKNKYGNNNRNNSAKKEVS